MKITIIITDEPDGAVGLEVQTDVALQPSDKITPALRVAERAFGYCEGLLSQKKYVPAEPK